MTIENILCLVVEWYIEKTDYTAEMYFCFETNNITESMKNAK